MAARRVAVLGLVFTSFLTGLFGLIFEEISIILALHKMISIVVVFFLAIYVFVFSSMIFPKSRENAKQPAKKIF